MNRRPERFGDLLAAVLADLVATHTATNGEPPMNADLLRRAADKLDRLAKFTNGQAWTAAYGSIVNDDGWRVISVGDQDLGDSYDTDWIATLGPQLAAPLAAWLRAEADDLASVEAQNARADARAERAGGDGHTYVMNHACTGHAVQLARVILGDAA